MTKQQIQKVKNALRKLTFSDPFRNAAKKRAYIAPGLHKCENCGVLCYSGSSLRNLEQLSEQYGEICTVDKWIKGRIRYYGIELDHIEPVVEPINGFLDWNLFMERMFPENSKSFQNLCVICHNIKTKMENEDRGRDNIDWDDFYSNL